jgi:hypothetical protein
MASSSSSLSSSPRARRQKRRKRLLSTSSSQDRPPAAGRSRRRSSSRSAVHALTTSRAHAAGQASPSSRPAEHAPPTSKTHAAGQAPPPPPEPAVLEECILELSREANLTHLHPWLLAEGALSSSTLAYGWSADELITEDFGQDLVRLHALCLAAADAKAHRG